MNELSDKLIQQVLREFDALVEQESGVLYVTTSDNVMNDTLRRFLQTYKHRILTWAKQSKQSERT